MVKEYGPVRAEINRLLSEEPLIRRLARALYESLDYSDTGIEWEALSESDREFYCGAIESVRGELMCHFDKSADGRPTTA